MATSVGLPGPEPGLDPSRSGSAGLLGPILIAVAVVTAGACLSSPRLAPTIAFSAVFAVTLVERLYKKDLVFAGLYTLLYVYTVFAQIAYVVYPEDVVLQAPGLYSGQAAFGGYVAFLTASFVLTWLIRLKLRRIPESISGTTRTGPPRPAAVATVLAVHTLSLVLAYWLVAPALSYSNQAPLKSNPILAILYSVLPTALLVLLALMQQDKRLLWRVLFVLDAALLLMYSIRLGARIDLVGFMLGATYWVFSGATVGSKSLRVRRLLAAVLILVGTLIITSGIRNSRADTLGARSLIDNPVALGVPSPGWINARTLVLQDYFVPGLTLIHSMARDAVIPRDVLISNASNSAILISSPSLGDVTSRSADPSGKQGYGYYLFTEGFNAAGPAGVGYNALVANLGLLLWEAFYRRFPSIAYRRLMEAVAFLGLLSVVRGQSSVFLSLAYTSLLPAAALFLLATGQRRSQHPAQRAS